MKLRKKNPSNVSKKSQASTSSVSPIASATRKFVGTLKPSQLGHTQSMPLVLQNGTTSTRVNIEMISAPLIDTAVNLTGGHYPQDCPLGVLRLPYPPIHIEDHWLPAGEFHGDGPASVFEPRETCNDADVVKIEPRPVQDEDTSSSDFTLCIPVPARSPQYRQRTASLVDNSRRRPRTERAYPPRRPNNTPLQEESLNILRPLSPVHEEESNRRHARCFAFQTFDDLIAEVQKLECEED